MIPTKVRERIHRRDGRFCARCDRSLVDYPSSIHHRLPRRMGGTKNPLSNDTRNLITLCGTGTTGCHGWVESHREEALAQGWLIRSYDDLDAPMLRLDGLVIRLSGFVRAESAPDTLPVGGEPA